ncbi:MULTISPECIES: methionine ABC transporter ATP-binding protein [Clostridioides]|uniref:methionine ABC transporter ATP-binding protein n=1 Tax=Clostridioides sp. ZZV14-6387 TaxID=2811497 RepID=UPI001430E4C4|nr:methionine ABC transporter ATP-binding protein [Clostridioides sp. ZZV14-6387]NJJ36386.1 methionine ABC transporter ATP-binding protein [Clostridioides difficile]NJK12977.1 methionine ABC transporter ATP-binding protein [Clostridioides difficile]
MINVSKLYKSFGSLDVLKDISLSIEQGEIFGLIGKSGAGKSTLLRCINLLEDYEKGEILVDGCEIKNNSYRKIREYRKNIGMIFQHFSLLERQNVYNNIAIPMKCWGYKKDEIEKKVMELVKIVGIEDKIYQKPKELSGGQRQRVAIARALSLEPKILLSDEATSALDPETTKSILSLLREINERLNITIVLVTHQMDVIREICNRVAILEYGKIAALGDVQKLFLNQPDCLKRLLGEQLEIMPEEGVNIRILFKQDKAKNTLIPEMAKQIPVNFSIVSSKLEKFRDDIIGSTVINMDARDKKIISEYLNSRCIIWEALDNG